MKPEAEMCGELSVREGDSRYGIPAWRAVQRSLPVAEKLELIGRFIRETLELERIMEQCKKSARS